MTEDELFEAAWLARQALKSPEHAADVEKAEKLSVELEAVQSRIIERQNESMIATGKLRDFHRGQVASGEKPAADNTEAKAVIDGHSEPDPVTVKLSVPPVFVFGDIDTDEFSSSRFNGASTED